MIVEDILLEYGGVSDEIIEAAEMVRNEALELLNSNKYPSIDRWKKICLNFGVEDMYPGGDVEQSPQLSTYPKRYCLPFGLRCVSDIDFVSNITIHAYGYNMSNISEYYAYSYFSDCLTNIGKNTSYFEPGDSIIILALPFGIDPRDGSVHIGDESFSVINHELKHAYQHHRRNKSQCETDKFYSASINKGESDSYTLKSLGLSISDIKYAYYILSFDEVDAILQQVYVYVSRNGGTLKSCSWYRYMLYAKDTYNKIYKYYTTSPYGYMLSGIFYRIYGSDIFKKYLSHCQRGIRRFDEHLRRVVGRLNNEHPGQRLFW